MEAAGQAAMYLGWISHPPHNAMQSGLLVPLLRLSEPNRGEETTTQRKYLSNLSKQTHQLRSELSHRFALCLGDM